MQIYKKSLLVGILVVILVLSSTSYANNVIWKGPADIKNVALTFDDGPKPELSQKILDILSKAAVRATFFVVGKEAKDYPDIIMRMDDEGHEIGNHTYSHINLLSIGTIAAVKELKMTNAVIKSIIGKQPLVFRPPGGGFDKQTKNEADVSGLRQVNWSVNAGDFISDSYEFELDEDYDVLARKLSIEIVNQVKNGDIVLLHNGTEQTVRALPVILSALRSRGFRFVTVSQLLEGKTI